MNVRLFDRYAKLREAVRLGHVVTGQKEILNYLKGRLGKDDLPALVVEPVGESELRAALEYAAEKKHKVAVAAGLSPVEVRGLEGQMLILTTRLSGAPVFSASRRSLRVEGGMPVESLLIDLNRSGSRWHPLLPVPSGSTMGELVASGWEGLRNWSGGGLLAHVGAVEWMGYDGRLHRTGPRAVSDSAVDVAPFIFGSRGTLGIITALEISVEPQPEERTAVLYELPSAPVAMELLAQLRAVQPQPETVVYWGETATQLLREGNDDTVSEQAVVLVSAEWAEPVRWPESETISARPYPSALAADGLWQDLLRFPRTAARLYPERTGARLRLPGTAVADLEEAAGELGRDGNLPVALWGTVEAGHFHVWVLQPDGQPRTQRNAEELLRRLVEVAVSLGGRCAPGRPLPFDSRAVNPARGSLSDSIRDQLLRRCDPQQMFVPLKG